MIPQIFASSAAINLNWADLVSFFKKIHNKSATRAMMSQLYDPQMAKLAEFDCFSQVVFKRLEDYKRFKQDPEYKRRLMGDHEKFADTKRSM